MNALPLYMKDAFGHPVGLVAALGLGIAFGFVLERAGFGRANVLAAQFYFEDMRVLKVMFSAIVTALVGMTVLDGVGVLDLAAVTVPGTWLWPQLAGGLLLGVGFIVSGYCPGTGVVALVSGKLDGFFAIFGVMLGSLAFGFAYPLVEGFYASGDLGVVRLPDLLGVPQAVVALAVTLMAVGAFLGAEKLERRFAPGRAPDPPVLRRRVLGLLGATAAVGMLTLAVPRGEPVHAARAIGTIDPLTLAAGIVERPDDWWIVDLRADAGDAPARVPGALAVPDDPAAEFVAGLPPTRTLVVYGAGDALELPAAVEAWPGEVRRLEGGFAAFEREILAPPGDDPATAADRDRHARREALRALFTGAEVRAAPPPVPKAVQRQAPKKGGGC